MKMPCRTRQRHPAPDIVLQTVFCHLVRMADRPGYSRDDSQRVCDRLLRQLHERKTSRDAKHSQFTMLCARAIDTLEGCPRRYRSAMWCVLTASPLWPEIKHQANLMLKGQAQTRRRSDNRLARRHAQMQQAALFTVEPSAPMSRREREAAERTAMDAFARMTALNACALGIAAFRRRLAGEVAAHTPGSAEESRRARAQISALVGRKKTFGMLLLEGTDPRTHSTRLNRARIHGAACARALVDAGHRRTVVDAYWALLTWRCLGAYLAEAGEVRDA